MSDETIDTNTTIPNTVTVWYKNITLWTNVVTVGALILTHNFGVAIDPQIQTGILAVINIILRVPSMAVTKARAKSRNIAIKAKMIK